MDQHMISNNRIFVISDCTCVLRIVNAGTESEMKAFMLNSQLNSQITILTLLTLYYDYLRHEKRSPSSDRALKND
ncbi:hypothetical protein BpHYR1_046600 [Brachionus plicatilis]|uniref:Uncharacterized protein n=1 Tax=Brachionus plicatilis TaxID=10195 RepID=A0A3M7S3J5_BRAPC|nr:hypothetical protein BpHYR1_046600 [Brachionus plicatilis]